MATIHHEVHIAADPAVVWDAVRDVGALHTRLVPGFVTDTVVETEPLARLVTFASGQVLREVIVSSDDSARRLVWTIVGAPVAHHNGAIQVFDAGDGGSRVVWMADVLPHSLAEVFGPSMAKGLAIMRTHLEAGNA